MTRLAFEEYTDLYAKLNLIDMDKVKSIEVQAAEIVAGQKEVSKRGKSVGVALKALNAHLETLKKAKVLNDGNYKTMSDIAQRITKEYIKAVYGV